MTIHTFKGEPREIGEQYGRALADEVRRFIFSRDDADQGTIHNEGTFALTYANPQTEKNIFWVGAPGQPFEPLEVLPKKK